VSAPTAPTAVEAIPSPFLIGPPPVLPLPPEPEPEPELPPEPEPEPELKVSIVPPAPKGRRYSAPPARSHAATTAAVTGLAPLLVSLAGNTIAIRLTTDAAAQAVAGVTRGVYTPVFVALALVFVFNAALLTVCGITAGRGLRETANGITRGRGLAIAGLVAGGGNLLLWVAGLIVTLTTLTAALA